MRGLDPRIHFLAKMMDPGSSPGVTGEFVVRALRHIIPPPLGGGWPSEVG